MVRACKSRSLFVLRPWENAWRVRIVTIATAICIAYWVGKNVDTIAWSIFRTIENLRFSNEVKRYQSNSISCCYVTRQKKREIWSAKWHAWTRGGKRLVTRLNLCTCSNFPLLPFTPPIPAHSQRVYVQAYMYQIVQIVANQSST